MAGRFCLRVFQSMVPGVAENAGLLFGLSYRLRRWLRHDFHAFLWSSTSVLWVWLESKWALVRSVIFLTSLSDRVSPSSQPVYDESPVSITVCTISEASTGIGYYYCIYIDLNLYILRRSKRLAFHQGRLVVCVADFIFRKLVICKLSGSQLKLWFCVAS